MKLLILSDLHLDTGDRFSTSDWTSERFIRKIDLIIALYGIDKVVLNGDVFDMINSPMKAIEHAQRDTMTYLKNIGAIFVQGNHDIGYADGLRELVIENSRGATIRIEHGHKAEIFNGTKPGRVFVRVLMKAMKLLTKWNRLHNRYHKEVLIDDAVCGKPAYRSSDCFKYAHKLLRTNDVVVLGHTHRLEESISYYGDDRKIYLNCGSCTKGKFQGVILDTESLRYELLNDLPEKHSTPKRIPALAGFSAMPHRPMPVSTFHRHASTFSTQEQL